MLQNIRNNIQGLMAKIIIALIIIPFALFGVESLVGSGGQIIVGEINGQDLTESEVQQAVNLQKRRMLNMLGEDIDPALLDDNVLRQQALDALVSKKLVLQSAQNYDIAISPAALDRIILEIPEFQLDGQFSPQLYENLLRSNGYSTAMFKQSLSEDQQVNQINQALAGSAFISEEELVETVRLIKQQRSYQYMTVPVQAVMAETTVSDDEIKDYYDQNIDDYQKPAQVKLDYIEIKQQDFYQPVSMDELKTAYDAEVADYQASEERRASHILIEITADRDESQAKLLLEQISQKLDQGERFADLAKTFSDDIGSAAQGGDLGYTQGDMFPESFEQALAELELNQVSEAVATDSGLHLIQLTDIKGDTPPSFEERKAALEQRLQKSASQSNFLRTVEELSDLVFNSEDLTGPADALKLLVKKSDWINKTTSTGLFANRKLINAAFSDDVLTDGNNSDVIELAANHFVVLRVHESQPQQPVPFAELKTQIEQKLKQEKATASLVERADTYIESLRSGESLQALAEKNDYEWKTESSVDRRSVNANRALIAKVFDMALPAQDKPSLSTVTLANGDVAVIALTEVVNGNMAEVAAAERKALRFQLERSRAQQSFEGFIRTIREVADISLL